LSVIVSDDLFFLNTLVRTELNNGRLVRLISVSRCIRWYYVVRDLKLSIVKNYLIQ